MSRTRRVRPLAADLIARNVAGEALASAPRLRLALRDGAWSAAGSGNPQGNRHRTRHLLNQEFMQALLLNFRHQGKRAIETVARNQPAAYLKILALLVPRELKVEQSQGVKGMSDEQLEAGIEAIQRMLEARAPGDQARVIEGVAEPAALPAPSRKPRRGAETKASPLLIDEQGERE